MQILRGVGRSHGLAWFKKFDPKRNAASLAARCRWGMRNGLFYVAKEEGSERVVGVAMWLPPRPVGQPRTWSEWWEGWRFWANQVGVNLWYGRGGLNVKVSFSRLDSRILQLAKPRTRGHELCPTCCVEAAVPGSRGPSSHPSLTRHGPSGKSRPRWHPDLEGLSFPAEGTC